MRKVLVLAVGVLALAATGCTATAPYAAKVNGVTISQGDLNNELTSIRRDPAYLNQIQSQSQVTGAGEDSFDSSFVAQVLNRQIVFQLVHQEAVRRGITISNQDLSLARGDTATALGGARVLNGLPVSTTHVLSSGIAGTMTSSGSGLQLSTIRNIAMAWVLTLPAAMAISGSLYWVFSLLF